jgi:hypothetical protein
MAASDVQEALERSDNEFLHCLRIETVTHAVRFTAAQIRCVPLTYAEERPSSRALWQPFVFRVVVRRCIAADLLHCGDGR